MGGGTPGIEMELGVGDSPRPLEIDDRDSVRSVRCVSVEDVDEPLAAPGTAVFVRLALLRWRHHVVQAIHRHHLLVNPRLHSCYSALFGRNSIANRAPERAGPT